MENWGPARALGYQLIIDGPLPSVGTLIADVETDESDVANFVGIAIIELGGLTVRYFSTLSSELKEVLNRSRFIGHNVKADLHWLNQWGCKISAADIAGDTMIAEYCRDTTGGSYGLKDLAKKHLGWEWTKYKDLVGKGKKKVTLDKQPVEVVAAYCGTDCAATAELSKRRLDPVARRIYEQLEMPVYRALFAMESLGAALDVPYLRKLDKEFIDRRDAALQSVRELVGKADFNPASPAQVKKYLHEAGQSVEDTRAPTLEKISGVPAIAQILEFKRCAKNSSTYTSVLMEKPGGIVHCRFNQVAYDGASEDSHGIRTGRLSSSEPNLQNIPARKEDGRRIRAGFIAFPGETLCVADYSQFQLRIIADLSQEPVFLEAFRKGEDIHLATAKRIFGDVAGPELANARKIAKTINFGIVFGCGADKLASVAGSSVAQAEKWLDSYWAAVPTLRNWIAAWKARAYVRGYTTTYSGRRFNLELLKSSKRTDRWKGERQAVNYTIQGGEAEIVKRALCRLAEARLMPLLQVHDEFVFSFPSATAEVQFARAKGIMSNAAALSVPLVVDGKPGSNWAEAK